jgi:hypothetical protein
MCHRPEGSASTLLPHSDENAIDAAVYVIFIIHVIRRQRPRRT